MPVIWIKDRAFTPAEYVAAGYEITPLPAEFAAEVERLRKIKALEAQPDFEVEVLPDEEVLRTVKVRVRVLIRPKCKTE